LINLNLLPSCHKCVFNIISIYDFAIIFNILRLYLYLILLNNKYIRKKVKMNTALPEHESAKRSVRKMIERKGIPIMSGQYNILVEDEHVDVKVIEPVGSFDLD